jgi:copper chaperone
MTKEVQFNVGMTCGGCSGAVTRILSKIEGVEKVDANVETKKVVVTCSETVEDQALLDALLNWAKAAGKAVELVK